MDGSSDEQLSLLVDIFSDLPIPQLQEALECAGGGAEGAIDRLLAEQCRASSDGAGAHPPCARSFAPTEPSAPTGLTDNAPEITPRSAKKNGRHSAGGRRGWAELDTSRPAGVGNHSLVRDRHWHRSEAPTSPEAQRHHKALRTPPPHEFRPSPKAQNIRRPEGVEVGAGASLSAPTGPDPHAAATGGLLPVLAGRFPWAGQEVVAAVLAACVGDARRATALLEDMSAPEEEPPGSTRGAREDGGRPSPFGAESQQEPIASAKPKDVGKSDEDLYWKHRGEAVRMGRRLRRLLKQAAAARAGGDHAQANLLSAQAKQLAGRVAQMHWEAAARIECELNGPDSGPSSLQKLDLHGLHVEEALDAVERRLNCLENMLSVKGAPRRLTIVVGRGRHSSNSEASIPRAVESYLLQRGSRVSHGRVGCLEVNVKQW